MIEMIENKKQKTCQPIDVTISADRNVVQKEEENKIGIQESIDRDATNVEPNM
jgi:hypothetical protein